MACGASSGSWSDTGYKSVESHSRCACEHQSWLKIEEIRVIVHSSTTQLQQSAVDRLCTKKGCVECCYAHSCMQICVASVGKYTALIPRTVRLLFSTCNCERGGRSRRERERQKKTKGIRSLHSKQCPCQSEHFPMEVLHLHF